MTDEIQKLLLLLKHATNKEYHVIINSQQHQLAELVDYNLDDPDYSLKYSYEPLSSGHDEEEVLKILYEKLLLEIPKWKPPHAEPPVFKWVHPDEIAFNSPNDQYTNRVLMRFDDPDKTICTGRCYIEEGGHRIWETDIEWPTLHDQFFDVIVCAEIPK